MGIAEVPEAPLGHRVAAGSLVWVRRRNGSWWPGRILGPEEMPASPLMSPKSGTPVKLLGRDDASVEWYNLEKSIRVKSFRCGEFDACIERAEASYSFPVRRREKYARREDAILHALELERNQLGVKQHKPGATTDNILALPSLEEDSKPFTREELVPETTPRTRALQDFGLRTAPPKKKHFQFVEWDSLQKPVDNHADILPCAGQGKNPLPLKRKPLQGGMPDESPAKRRDRRRPLHQVLENAKLTPFDSFQPENDIGIIPMQGEKEHMGAICRAKRSRCIYLPVDSNESSEHVGYSFKQTSISQSRVDSSHHYHGSMAEENTSSRFEAVDSDSSGRVSLKNNNEGDNLIRDSNPTTPETHHSHEHIVDAHAEAGASKWHLKGKRNIRNLLAKSPINITDGTMCNGADKGNTSHPSQQDFYSHVLVDVDLEVRASYKGEHVPLVSLMSRLNGIAVVGHPIQVEILEDSKPCNAAAAPSPIWKTARRTAIQRIPRSNPVESDPPLSGSCDPESKTPLNKETSYPSSLGRFSHPARLAKKSVSHSRRSTSGKFQRKLLSVPGQKIRTLSSLSREHKESGVLVKPQRMLPLVTCIPVKVAYSRLLEALGGLSG